MPSARTPRGGSDGRQRLATRRPVVGSARDGSLGGEQVEGRRAVRELLSARQRRVHEVLLATGRDLSPILAEIETLAGANRIPLRRVGPEEIAARAVTEAPQGVLARAEALRPHLLEELLGEPPAPAAGTLGAARAAPFLVVLDGVTDPRNLGSVLRTALSAGASGAVLPAHRSARLSPAATKAAAGAVEHLPIALVAGIPAALEQLARAGVWSVGLDAAGDVPVDDLELATSPVALVLGAEGRGLAALTRRRCDVLARIPLAGPLESINVAAAAAVACFAVARRRATADGR